MALRLILLSCSFSILNIYGQQPSRYVTVAMVNGMPVKVLKTMVADGESDMARKHIESAIGNEILYQAAAEQGLREGAEMERLCRSFRRQATTAEIVVVAGMYERMARQSGDLTLPEVPGDRAAVRDAWVSKMVSDLEISFMSRRITAEAAAKSAKSNPPAEERAAVWEEMIAILRASSVDVGDVEAVQASFEQPLVVGVVEMSLRSLAQSIGKSPASQAGPETVEIPQFVSEGGFSRALTSHVIAAAGTAKTVAIEPDYVPPWKEADFDEGIERKIRAMIIARYTVQFMGAGAKISEVANADVKAHIAAHPERYQPQIEKRGQKATERLVRLLISKQKREAKLARLVDALKGAAVIEMK